MKFGKLVVVALVASLFASLALAQGKPAVGSGTKGAPKGGPQGRGGMGFYEKLNLTPAQKTKIEAIFKAMRTKSEALRNQKLTEDQRRQKFMALRTETQNKVNAVLTPAQRKQLEAMRKKMMEDWKKNGGKGGPGGRGGGKGG